MCARRARARGRTAVVVAILGLAACGSPERTGSAFCRQLGEELPGIGQPMATGDDVDAMVARWERLAERAPLAIEDDVVAWLDLLKLAAAVDPADPAEVQALADATYRANQSAVQVRAWVLDTCAVDVSTGLTVAPPRTAPSTTVPPSTVPVTTVPDSTVPATTVAMPPASVPAAPGTTAAPAAP